MNKSGHNLLLADGNIDDCFFFVNSLKELAISAPFSTLNDSVLLINYLATLPGKIHGTNLLALNVPCKSGIDYLSEIKLNDKLKKPFLEEAPLLS